MASETDIVNSALSKLGAKTVASIDDTTPVARLAKQTLDGLRDAVLQAHHWNFAIKRVSLAASATSPEWGPDNAFDAPHDCLKVLQVDGVLIDAETTHIKIEGKQIVTSLSAPIDVQYVSRVTNYGMVSPLFAEALAARCAAEWALPITRQPSIQANMVSLYREKMSEAKAVDGQEGTPDRFETNTWLNARL